MTDDLPVAVALGSNLGDRERHLALARERIDALPQTHVVAASTIEETDPLGGMEQPAYLNQMLLLRTRLSPRDLLYHLHQVERAAGRSPHRTRWASRTLDCDIVLYGQVSFTTQELTIPHPGLSTRPFWDRELHELEIGWSLSGPPTWPLSVRDSTINSNHSRCLPLSRNA